jgi:hypothetical protein
MTCLTLGDTIFPAMRVHNRSSKPRAKPRGLPVTSKGKAPALHGQRAYGAEVFQRWVAAEEAAEKTKTAAPATGPPTKSLNTLGLSPPTKRNHSEV